MRVIVAIVMVIVVAVVSGAIASDVDVSMAVFVGGIIPTVILAERDGRA